MIGISMAERGAREPQDIELLAIFKGLQICSRMRIKKIKVESDCLLMVRECQVRGESSSILEHLVTEIKQLQASFKDCCFQHTF